MAQLAPMLRDAGPVQVYTDDQGRETYRLDSGRASASPNMLAMVEGQDADAGCARRC